MGQNFVFSMLKSTPARKKYTTAGHVVVTNISYVRRWQVWNQYDIIMYFYFHSSIGCWSKPFLPSWPFDKSSFLPGPDQIQGLIFFSSCLSLQNRILIYQNDYQLSHISPEPKHFYHPLGRALLTRLGDKSKHMILWILMIYSKSKSFDCFIVIISIITTILLH